MHCAIEYTYRLNTLNTHTSGLGQLINLIVNFYKLTIKLINLTS